MFLISAGSWIKRELSMMERGTIDYDGQKSKERAIDHERRI
jgi:hypothetical protein